MVMLADEEKKIDLPPAAHKILSIFSGLFTSSIWAIFFLSLAMFLFVANGAYRMNYPSTPALYSGFGFMGAWIFFYVFIVNLSLLLAGLLLWVVRPVLSAMIVLLNGIPLLAIIGILLMRTF